MFLSARILYPVCLVDYNLQLDKSHSQRLSYSDNLTSIAKMISTQNYYITVLTYYETVYINADKTFVIQQ